MPRDNQRSRLYAAEKVLAERRVSRAATTLLIDTERHSWWAERDENGKSRALKYPNIQACQAYVDAVTEARWFQSRWGRRRFTLVAGSGSHAGYSTITLSAIHRRSEAVILHEMAHCLTPGGKADHGPEFAGILLTLVAQVMGAEHARDLRDSFRQHRVRYTMDCVPTPRTETVVTKAQKAAKTRAQQNLGDRLGLSTKRQREVAASVIRSLVKDGEFGPAGCKPRAHALATARLLEREARS